MFVQIQSFAFKIYSEEEGVRPALLKMMARI